MDLTATQMDPLSGFWADLTWTHIITTLVALPPCTEGQQPAPVAGAGPAQRVTSTTQNISVCPLPPLEHNTYTILLLYPVSGIHAWCPAVSIPAQLVLLYMHNDNQRLFYSVLLHWTQHITLSCCAYLDIQMEELKLEALKFYIFRKVTWTF